MRYVPTPSLPSFVRIGDLPYTKSAVFKAINPRTFCCSSSRHPPGPQLYIPGCKAHVATTHCDHILTLIHKSSLPTLIHKSSLPTLIQGSSFHSPFDAALEQTTCSNISANFQVTSEQQ
jgi:hypothetical protein